MYKSSPGDEKRSWRTKTVRSRIKRERRSEGGAAGYHVPVSCNVDRNFRQTPPQEGSRNPRVSHVHDLGRFTLMHATEAMRTRCSAGS